MLKSLTGSGIFNIWVPVWLNAVEALMTSVPSSRMDMRTSTGPESSRSIVMGTWTTCPDLITFGVVTI